MYIDRNGEDKVKLSLTTHEDGRHLPQLIAPHLGWVARQGFRARLWATGDLAVTPVDVTMPTEDLASVAESIVDIGSELVRATAAGNMGPEKLRTFALASKAIQEFNTPTHV